MSTITLPNIRVSSDLTIRLKLKDGGVAIDWSTLQNIRVSLYADDQRSMASRCNVSIDEEDSTILVCQYAANKMQYLGVNRVIVQCKYLGEVKTYDKPAFTFVRWTSDQEGEQITIDDPDVDVEITVEDVSSSILQEAVDAAFDAADRANDAAAAAEHMVDIHTGPAGKSPYIGENGHWYEWDEETHQYVDTETNAKGDTGETPDISIGTVTTVEPGTPAAASMSGTPEAPVLNLSIPKGLVGATPNFTVGTVTTGEPGSSVIVTITGTPEAPVLNLTIPQGMQGNTGSSVDYPFELVNNLTTDDATKALSAAQGKVLDGKVSQLQQKVDEIDEALDVETTSEVVTERIEQGWNKGYVNQYGSIALNFTETMHSDPIFLKAGEVLTVNGVTRTWAARFASYNPDTGTYSVIQMGTSANNDAASIYESSYTADSDIYIVLSWSYDVVPVTVTKTYTKVTTTSALDGIAQIEDILEIESSSDEITENVTFDSTDSKALTGGEGRKCAQAAYSAYSQSDPVFLNEGDKITVATKNAAANIAVVAYQEGPEDDPFYRSLVAGNASDQTATFIVPFSTYFVFSYVKAQGITVTREYTRNETDSERIKALENSIGQVDNLAGQVTELDGEVADVKGKVNPIVTDDMTTDIVTGKYIGHNGGISTNASFAYKEFQVRAGAKITVQCAGHTNIAIIAKKVSDTKYEELVAGTTFAQVTVNYVATETMTIAVSFYATQDRSIVIDTDYVDSNHIEIVALQQKDADDEVRQIDLGFLFNKIAVIGDSMSVATMDGYSGPLGASWLSFLAKRWASVGKEWYAMGGTSAYQWLNNTNYGLGKLLSDETIYNCYFIAYGHNDSATVGEATDEAAPVTITDGVPSCPDGYSFCAYYKAIINQIRTKAPHAMIFCLSQYDYSVAPGGWHSQYGEAVVDVAELMYNGGDKLVHHLDTGGVPISDMEIGGHYSTIGYAYIAKRINDEANKVIYQYHADTEIKTFGVYNL